MTATKTKKRQRKATKPQPQADATWPGQVMEARREGDIESFYGYLVTAAGDEDRTIALVRTSRADDQVERTLRVKASLELAITIARDPAVLDRGITPSHPMVMLSDVRPSPDRETPDHLYGLECQLLDDSHVYRPYPYCPTRFKRMLKQFARQAFPQTDFGGHPKVVVSLDGATDPEDTVKLDVFPEEVTAE